ncbi:het-domain-containing protein [Fusarium flagelliforme]|uniref:Het-domain-containing protein n=1 Tax=Fusarium flagelliforme TaxID=2675880 RepID=A0A395M9U2_9HYPO|nr:het-domain-containing protein [Fusarium flagelliforme]
MMSSDIIHINKDTATKLCSNCKAVDFDAILSLDQGSLKSGYDVPIPNGRKVADLVGNPNTWSSAACPLCRLYAFTTLNAKHGSDVDNTSYSLVVRSTAKMLENKDTFTGEVRMADVATIPQVILQVFHEPINMFNPCLYVADYYLFDQDPLDPKENTVIKTQPHVNELGYINASILKSFLDYCWEHHTDSLICGTDHQPQGFGLPLFKVIDVESLCIVDAGQDPTYTALSYRWGDEAYDPSRQPFDDKGQLRDASALPLMISDALKVTKDLGFRYCWVDRYCIPQNDPQAMEVQFGQMDLTYRSAAVTIIADSCSPFLPGVTQKLKTMVSPVQIGERNIAAANLRFKNIELAIGHSPWATRAWTYQEGLFSRRRLFFTDLGVYYECGRMASAEQGFAAPQPRWSLREGDKAPWLLSASSFERENALVSCLETYSKRVLTFVKDRLSAALGILHAFEAPGQLMRHYLGTPILQSESTETNSMEALILGFLKGMLWHEGSNRCHDLPSWSWAGWTGEIFFFKKTLEITSAPTLSSRTAIHIKSELMDGKLLPWDSVENIQQIRAIPISAVSRFIHLDAYTVQIPLDKGGFEDSHPLHNPVESYVLNLGTKEQEEAVDKEFPFTELRYRIMEIAGRGQIYVEVDIQRWPKGYGLKTGIVILSDESNRELVIVLVEPTSDGSNTMERCGIIRIGPDTVFFRPFLGPQRKWLDNLGEQDNPDKYYDWLDTLTEEEQCEEAGMPSWKEFLTSFWDTIPAKRQCIRLG